MFEQKVFCIGFQKTGTTSLGEALGMLGYSVTGPNFLTNQDLENQVYNLAFTMAEKHDAFQDNPWPLLYKEMDQKFPGSKFILTTRPLDEWIDSVVRHFGTRETAMRRWIYGSGCPQGNEDRYTERYELHNREVLEYFRDRPEDLLVFNVTAGDSWDKLCPFLDRDIPDTDFPHSNKAEDRENKKENTPRGALIREMIKRRRQQQQG